MKNVCLRCKKSTDNAKFCSRTCAIIINNTKSPKRIMKKRACRMCNKVNVLNSSSSRFCEPCRVKRAENSKLIGKQTLADISKRYKQLGIAPSYRHAYVRNHCHVVNRNLPKRCQVCDYSTHVELCHIKAISSFSLETTLDEINDPSNIVVLCRNHHWELDSGHISIDDIKINR